MGFILQKNGKKISLHVKRADTFLTRLIGLMGSNKNEPEGALHIVPCSSIHTFGMHYPIDVLFLDSHQRIIHTINTLKPNKMTRIFSLAKSVLELPSGTIQKNQIEVGDVLDIVEDDKHRVNLKELRNLFHWPINVILALLWSKFVLIAITDWLMNSGPINLGILLHNTLLFILFLTRRKSKETSFRLMDWIIPILTLGCTMMLQPNITSHPYLFTISGLLQCIGLLAIILSTISLGRSFGVIPANRKIKYSGAYKLIRHPLYASEIIFYSGFLLGNASIINILFVTLIVGGQVWRSVAEENLLSKDPIYRGYLKSVHYRFIPGLF